MCVCLCNQALISTGAHTSAHRTYEFGQYLLNTVKIQTLTKQRYWWGFHMILNAEGGLLSNWMEFSFFIFFSFKEIHLIPSFICSFVQSKKHSCEFINVYQRYETHSQKVTKQKYCFESKQTNSNKTISHMSAEQQQQQ